MKPSAASTQHYGQGWQALTGCTSRSAGAILGQMFPLRNVDGRAAQRHMNMVYPDAFTGVKAAPVQEVTPTDLKWNVLATGTSSRSSSTASLTSLRTPVLTRKGRHQPQYHLDRGYRDTWSWAMGVRTTSTTVCSCALATNTFDDPRSVDTSVLIGDATLRPGVGLPGTRTR